MYLCAVCRACLNSSGGGIDLYLMDIGRWARLDRRDLIVKLPEFFYDFEPQARKCSLQDATPQVRDFRDFFHFIFDVLLVTLMDKIERLRMDGRGVFVLCHSARQRAHHCHQLRAGTDAN